MSHRPIGLPAWGMCENGLVNVTVLHSALKSNTKRIEETF